MTDSATERGARSSTAGVDSEDALIARIAADRRVGKDTSKDVDKLLRLTEQKNRAAIDRLAQS